MQKNILKRMKNDINEHYKLYLVYVLILFISLYRINYYIYSPGSLVNLTDRIIVDNSYNQKGNFNLTYVTSRHATILTYLLSYIIPNWDLENIDEVRIDNEEDNDIFTRGQIYLKETSYDAVIAAFNEANIPYEIKSIDVTVTHVFESAKTNLKIGDIIKKINGIKINSVDDISNILKDYNENDKIVIEVLRNNKIVSCYAYIRNENNRNIIGVALALIKDVETNPKVEFVFKDSESGSSRGLMCALDIYNKITEYDLTKGDIISGTGTIDENGNVIEIDGVKYKLLGAVNNNAKVFIVPSKNYGEAIKIKNNNNYDIEIIEATTLHDVIEKLKAR